MGWDGEPDPWYGFDLDGEEEALERSARNKKEEGGDDEIGWFVILKSHRGEDKGWGSSKGRFVEGG